MRKARLLLVPVTLVALVAGPLAVTTSAAAPKRAELVAKPPTGSFADGKVSVVASVKNKGNKKARKTQTGFFLSTDGTKSPGDASLGTLPTRKIKPKRTRVVSGALALPAGLQPGVYRLIACADVTRVVRERKEQNNCKASRTSVTLPGGPAPAGKVTVAATATPGGTVAASGISGGACVGTFCTLTSGAGTVTFTPTAAAGYEFTGWTGCTGFTGTTAITFTNPTESKSCTATFVRQVTISWTAAPVPVVLLGSVAGSASHGTCTGSDPITGAGSCTADAGVGTVVLTAIPTVGFRLAGWSAISGQTCDGAASGNTMTFTAPAAAKGCVATFELDLLPI